MNSDTIENGGSNVTLPPTEGSLQEILQVVLRHRDGEGDDGPDQRAEPAEVDHREEAAQVGDGPQPPHQRELAELLEERIPAGHLR